jgi:phage tail protein X
MAVTRMEEIEIRGDNILPDLLVWRRYKRRWRNGLAAFLDANPELMGHLGMSPFLPIGMFVRMPIDDDAMKGTPQSTTVVRLTD